MNSKVASQREFDVREMFPDEAIDGVTDVVANVDQTDLVDKQSSHSTGNAKLGTMDGWAS